MKCATCGKEIKNAYYIDGKVYGYNCYKLALAEKYKKLEELKNDDYSRKCISLIEVFKTKTFKDKWNKDFQESILNQFQNGHKLTGKQFNLMISKLDDIDKIEYNFLYLELSKIIENDKYYTVESISNNLDTLLLRNSDMLRHFKEDERLFTFIREYKARSIKRGHKFYLIETKDEDDNKSYMEIANEKELNNYKNDEYIEILFVREV